MWYSAKARAKKSGLEFDLRAEDIQVPEHCPLLGIKLEPGNEKKPAWNSPSLDRYDSMKGYVRGKAAFQAASQAHLAYLRTAAGLPATARVQLSDDGTTVISS
jgi:hypothetical protein